MVLEHQHEEQAVRTVFDLQCALVANGSLTENSFTAAKQSARECFEDLMGLWRPWEGRSYVDRKGKEFRDARQAYIAATGMDPLSDEFKKWEAEKIAEKAAGMYDEARTPDVSEIVAANRKRLDDERKAKRQGRH
jgi:hypothetical protein